MFLFTSEFSRKVRNSRKVSRGVNILMMLLCLVACIAIYLIEQQKYKIALSLLLLLYSIFVCIHQNLFRLIFSITDQSNNSQNDITVLSNSKKVEDEVKMKEKEKGEGGLSKYSRLSSHDNQESFNASRSNLFKDIPKDSSFSSFRSISASYNIEKTTLNESKGYSLQNIFNLNNSSQSSKSALNFLKQDKSFTIVQRKVSSRTFQQKIKAQNEQLYEEQLKNQIKKSHSEIQSSYKKILNQIQRVLNPIINEHLNNQNKIKEIAAQFFDITIVNEKQCLLDAVTLEPAYFKFKKQTLPVAMPLQTLIFKLSTIYLHNANPELTAIPLKRNKSWDGCVGKLNELLKIRMRIGQQLGISEDNIRIKSSQPLKAFIQQYNRSIVMIQSYIKSDLNHKKTLNLITEDYEDEHLSNLYRSRILILHIFLKNLNQSMESEGKIQISSYLSFKKQQLKQVSVSIKPKYMYDSIVPHLFVLKSEDKKVYNCQFGQRNYLSTIYFTLLSLKGKTIYSSDPYLYKLIQEAL